MQSNRSDGTAQSAKNRMWWNAQRTDGYPSALYGSERIYFCTQSCLRVFEQDPHDFWGGKARISA